MRALYVTMMDMGRRPNGQPQFRMVRCTKEGVVDWTNTRVYTNLEIFDQLLRRSVHLIKCTEEKNGTARKPDWMQKILKGL